MLSLTEEGLGYGEEVSEAAVEDANQVLSQLHVLDLILADGNEGGPERWNKFVGHLWTKYISNTSKSEATADRTADQTEVFHLDCW